MTTRINYEHEPNLLNDGIKEMGRMAEASREMVRKSIEAFIKQDLETAKQIQRQDDVVDELFGKVKDDAVALLLQSTEQIDLCIDLLMVAKYLERIGDHAVNVCEWTEFSKTGALKNVRIL